MFTIHRTFKLKQIDGFCFSLKPNKIFTSCCRITAYEVNLILWSSPLCLYSLFVKKAALAGNKRVLCCMLEMYTSKYILTPFQKYIRSSCFASENVN